MNIEEILNQPDGSLEEINIQNYLDTIEYPKRIEALNQVFNKLSQEGTIHISGVEYFSLGRLMVSGKASIEEVNAVFASTKSIDTFDSIKRYLIQNNFNIITKSRHEGLYAISAKHHM